MDISRLAQKLRESDFGPDESVIASSIMHPIEAAKRGAEWFGGQVNRAANIPDPFDNPNPTRGYTPEQQLEAGLNLAGMAQTGAFPMAPATRGGTLGTITLPKKFQIAQKNAALPIEEGGLGLPANNTAMDRADAMGALDWFHGTERLDRLLAKKAFDPKRATSGPMPFGTTSEELASNYAMNKADTSRIAADEGNMASYFQVSPKSLGMRGTTPYSVEQSYYYLSPEKRQELLKNYYRVGYENPEEATGNFVLHPNDESSIASKQHLDYVLQREGKGNPLSALRHLWGESGELFDNPEALADVYKVAGYPHEILQENAPWYSAKGVFTGKVMSDNPLTTSNIEELQNVVIPHLEEAFKNDRTKVKNWGADPWDKNLRFTPKDWVQTLKKDLEAGNNSFVWTSIPDKITKELKSLGYDAIHDVSGKGGGLAEHPVIIPFEPNQVRSRFAAFDPFRKHEADLLAAGVAVPASMMEEDENPKLARLLREK